jgi:hypothetical protein
VASEYTHVHRRLRACVRAGHAFPPLLSLGQDTYKHTFTQLSLDGTSQSDDVVWSHVLSVGGVYQGQGEL